MNNKEVAILGSSPIMCLLALNLSKKYNVTMFTERPSLGGAWSINTLSGENIPSHNNIVYPFSKKEILILKKIEAELNKKKINFERTNSFGFINSKFKPEYALLVDFSNLFKLINESKKISLNIYKINEVISNNKEVKLNNKKFSFLFLPANFQISKLNLENNTVKPVFVRNVSEHLQIKFSDKINFKYRYTENFDNVFDRGGFNENFTIFTGRIRKNYKGVDLEELVKESVFFNSLISKIIILKKNYYDHKAIDFEHIKKEIISYKHIKILDTRQFVHGYYSMLQEIEQLV